jgi:hypothetical protein
MRFAHTPFRKSTVRLCRAESTTFTTKIRKLEPLLGFFGGDRNEAGSSDCRAVLRFWLLRGVNRI